jgi:hypothetical protein
MEGTVVEESEMQTPSRVAKTEAGMGSGTQQLGFHEIISRSTI